MVNRGSAINSSGCNGIFGSQWDWCDHSDHSDHHSLGFNFLTRWAPAYIRTSQWTWVLHICRPARARKNVSPHQTVGRLDVPETSLETRWKQDVRASWRRKVPSPTLQGWVFIVMLIGSRVTWIRYGSMFIHPINSFLQSPNPTSTQRPLRNHHGAMCWWGSLHDRLANAQIF